MLTDSGEANEARCSLADLAEHCCLAVLADRVGMGHFEVAVGATALCMDHTLRDALSEIRMRMNVFNKMMANCARANADTDRSKCPISSM